MYAYVYILGSTREIFCEEWEAGGRCVYVGSGDETREVNTWEVGA